MKEKEIKSWIGKNVRIKREFIIIHEEGQGATIKCDNGMNGVIYEPLSSIFMVKMDIYGVDLFNHRRDGLILDILNDPFIEDVKATHQLIIEVVEGGNKIGYPYLWDSKYFEEVFPIETTTTTWGNYWEAPRQCNREV